MQPLEQAFVLITFGFSLCALLSGMGLMLRMGMSFLWQVILVLLALTGSIILLNGQQALIPLMLIGLALLGAMISLLPKFMRTMQNTLYFVQHIGYLLMSFISAWIVYTIK